MSLLHDGLKLARLKLSIGRNHTADRPLTPIEVAKYIDEMINALDDPAGKKVAGRLGVSTSLIREFHNLLKSPPKFYDLWGWGTSKGGRIAWSQGREACDFFGKNIISEDELGSLIHGVVEEEIEAGDMREIVRLRKKNPDKSFAECYTEISNLIPKTIESIIFITDLDPSVIKNIDKQAAIKSVTSDYIAESIIVKYLGSENVDGVLIKNEMHIKIAITEQGRTVIDRLVEKECITLNKIINHLFIKEGF